MNPKAFGKQILLLRKNKGLTQKALAELLNVSDKTVSKWENGIGYPEITQIPSICKIFNIPSDTLLCESVGGITIAGNIIVDSIKNIDVFPISGMLANIGSISRASGGCVCNTLIDLARIDKSLRLSALGRIGDDEYGRFVMSQMQKHSIDTSEIIISSTAPTGFSDVFNETQTKSRTFFTKRGANEEFCVEDVNVMGLSCDIFHIGYLLLLASLDKADDEYGTKMARLLHDIQSVGIKTSIDTVSQSDNKNASKIILPALKYCNYTIMNEIEACGAVGLSPRNDDGSLNINNIEKSLSEFIRYGVSDYAIIHAPEAGFAYSANGELCVVGSLEIEKNRIMGTTGAGDAFCAGCLYGLYNGIPIKQTLEFASLVAASSLFAEDAVSGVMSKKDIYKLADEFKRREIIL